MTGPDERALTRACEAYIGRSGPSELCALLRAALALSDARKRPPAVEAWEDGPVGVGMSDKAAPAPRCTEYLREHGQGYRWPCERCGAGPCRARAGVNPAPVMSERGERQPVPCGITHGPGSPIVAEHSGPSDRRVPRFDGKRINPELTDGDGA